MKTLFRLDIISMIAIAAFFLILVCLLDTGRLAQWLADQRTTKIDEAIFVGMGLVVAAGIFALRRWFRLSRLVAQYNDTIKASPEISRVKQAQQRDIFGVALAITISVVLVFLFDTGSIAEWIARHKDSKVDEIVVTGVIVLVGLLFFSVRRWFELTEQVVRYEKLHRYTTGSEPRNQSVERTRRITAILSFH